MNLSEEGASFIKEQEGCRLQAYEDVVGVATIGYGHTPCNMGDEITQDEADNMFEDDARQFEQCVEQMVEVSLTQGQFDALVSFSYNLGCHTLLHSTLLRLLNQEDYNGAAQEFVKWDHAGGREVGGLRRRREAEQEMFLAGDLS